MNQLKALVLDIETFPIVAYVWDRHDQNIALNQIKTDWTVASWAAKWLGKAAKSTMYMDTRKDSELTILRALWKLLDEADILVTQNGKAFDSKKLNARFIMHGMQPPSAYKHLDTYLIAKHAGAFTANSLEYLTDKLCTKYKKLTHSKFPGMALWKECLAGNKAAWNEMKRYNIHDVLATEELYGKLRAWAPKNAPSLFIVGDPTVECDTCGARGRMQSRGPVYSSRGMTKKYQCQACNHWQLGKVHKEAA